MTSSPSEPAFLCLLLLSLLLQGVVTSTQDAKIRIVPSILNLPAPVTYLDASADVRDRPTESLTCEVWPPNAEISLLAHPASSSSTPSAESGAGHATLTLEALSPFSSAGVPFSVSRPRLISPPPQPSVPAAATELVPAFSNAAVTLSPSLSSEEDSWRRLDAVDVHCRAKTPFATVLSAPFRLVQSRLPDLSSTVGEATKTRVEEFINGNVAYVVCRIPPGAHPPPTVQFYLNGSLITPSRVNGREKYKQVQRPNEDRVLLLISAFKAADEGDYRCALTNPVTGHTVWSPEIVRLQVRAPDKPIAARVLLPLAPQDNTSSSAATASRQITVREGDNVTLVCVMEGAPPPEMHTYPHNSHHNRYTMDPDFGLLQLVNVQPADEGVYLCSTTYLSLTATLKVKPRLRLTQSPQDVRLSSLGKRAEFRCATSDPAVVPLWLFNGEPVFTLTPQVLVIDSVRESDLGLYQCIARSLTPDGRTDEWVSANALLTLYSDKVVTKAADLVDYVPRNLKSPTSHQRAVTREMTPRVEMALDNFAVYLTWNVSDASLLTGLEDQPVAFQIEYASLIRESVLNPALEGLIPPEPPVWSNTQRLDRLWKKRYGFVVGSPLEPGKTYRFRVRAVATQTGGDVIPPSDWSENVSTHHISSAPPPRITSVQPYHDGRFNVTWEYAGEEVFRPDFFLILVRPLLRSSSSNENDKNDANAAAASAVHYGRYRATQVNGSDAREAFVYNLNASVRYQLVVYGVKYENGERRITRFSEAEFATLPEVPGFGTFSLMRAVAENKAIFIGLGALALLIFLVVLVLVIMCIARQRKYRRNRRHRVKHNGFNDASEKHPLQSPSQQQMQQSGGSLSPSVAKISVSNGNGAAVVANNGSAAAAQGQAMLMGTLMRQQHQQAQQAGAYGVGDPQAAAMAAAAAAYMGGYYGNSVGGAVRPHHQSHHSLLLPVSTPQQQPVSMFHSGTLPQGMRSHYHHQQPMVGGGGYGSQQVLNQSMIDAAGGDPQQQQQATLMRDFYHQQMYQQQLMNQQQQQQQNQQFMQYATSGGFMSPQQQQQVLDTLSRQHSQSGFPYGVGGGSMHSTAASLKRDPTGGSLHDEGTLLARSPMSPHPGSMIGDQIPPPGYFQTPMYVPQHLMSPPVQMAGAPFYPGQTPTDHMNIGMHSMGHHTDGESIYSYFSQQDACHPPPPHNLLNPLPEENQMGLGYTESGSQTAGLDGAGSPAQGGGGTHDGSHRHHRRRRRKPQQQSGQHQQQQQAGQFGGSGEGEGYQFSVSGEGGQNGEQIALMSMMDSEPRRTNGGGGGGLNSGATPPSAAGLEQGTDSTGAPQMEQRSANQSFDRSTPSYGVSPGMGMRSSLPPPSQPPPPPPPAAMMMMNAAAAASPSGPGFESGSSLNRRVLVGAPPRIRDYSEYGIPTSLPSNQPMKQSGMTSPPPPPPPPPPGHYNTNSGGSLRYREGQA